MPPYYSVGEPKQTLIEMDGWAYMEELTCAAEQLAVIPWSNISRIKYSPELTNQNPGSLH
jgi:hypothetical protein